MYPLLAATLATLISWSALGAISPELRLWPADAPGEKGGIGEEKDMTKASDALIAGKPLIRLGNVTQPSITLFRAPKEKDTGATVMVFPGGGYHILAMALEGTEVCQWLNSIGVNAVLLKYRVPKRPGLERHTAALQDAQRAMGLFRQHASDWNLDPHRIGVLGFSAGGHLAAALGSNSEKRTYPEVDAADQLSCRPAFTILIYPGYLTVKEDADRIPPELKVTSDLPPTFIAMSQDDPVRVEGALLYSLALKQSKVPAELHIYPTGGHGYGLRRTHERVTTWPDRLADWMQSQGFLREPKR